MAALTKKGKVVLAVAKKAAIHLVKATQQRWEDRNKQVQEVEQHNGVHAAKVAAGKRQWRWERIGPPRKRGRPPKPWEELSATQRWHRESRSHREEAVRMLGEPEGVEDHKLWLRDRRERRRRGAQPARIQLTIDSWDKSGIRGRDEAWARAGAIGTMGRAATWAQRARGVAGKKPHGMCTYGDCQEPGTQAAMGCLEGKALRCGNCAWLACWGRSECQCKAPLLCSVTASSWPELVLK